MEEAVWSGVLDMQGHRILTQLFIASSTIRNTETSNSRVTQPALYINCAMIYMESYGLQVSSGRTDLCLKIRSHVHNRSATYFDARNLYDYRILTTTSKLCW